jgi:hypothetical protein
MAHGLGTDRLVNIRSRKLCPFQCLQKTESYSQPGRIAERLMQRSELDRVLSVESPFPA